MSVVNARVEVGDETYFLTNAVTSLRSQLDLALRPVGGVAEETDEEAIAYLQHIVKEYQDGREKLIALRDRVRDLEQARIDISGIGGCNDTNTSLRALSIIAQQREHIEKLEAKLKQTTFKAELEGSGTEQELAYFTPVTEYVSTLKFENKEVFTLVGGNILQFARLIRDGKFEHIKALV